MSIRLTMDHGSVLMIVPASVRESISLPKKSPEGPDRLTWLSGEIEVRGCVSAMFPLVVTGVKDGVR